MENMRKRENKRKTKIMALYMEIYRNISSCELEYKKLLYDYRLALE